MMRSICRLRATSRLPAAVCGFFLSTFPVSAASETVVEALCRLIESNAQSYGVPSEFLTRLIWQESSFRSGVTSPAGAQGVAQFMPGTARERGLRDPFDPEEAIPEAARFIAELTERFGNRGLAAAAYNGGPARVAAWMGSRRDLAAETRHYVNVVTGRPIEEWLADRDPNTAGSAEVEPLALSCLQVTALLRRPGRDSPEVAPIAPWGVQLAGNFSKERALRSFARVGQLYEKVLGDIQPMVIGTRLRHRGTRTFYRIRIPAATRDTASHMCQRIRGAGGSCIVLPS